MSPASMQGRLTGPALAGDPDAEDRAAVLLSQDRRPARHPAFSRLLRGRLVTAVDDPTFEDGGLLIGADGRVEAAGSWDEMRRLWPGTPLFDHRPHWIVPGMIDLHVHLTLPGDGTEAHIFYAHSSHERLLMTAYANAAAALRAGVTSLRDCGGRASAVLGLRDAIRAGTVDGPRLFVAGPPMTITGGHCHYMGGEVDGVEHVRRFSRALLKAGADFLKMMGSGGGTPGTHRHRTTFTLEELRAAGDEARRAGAHLAVHATNRDATRLAVEAGVETIEHAILGTLEGDTSFDPRLADQMARQGCVVSPTLQASLGHIRALEALAASGGISPATQHRLDALKRRTDMKLDHVALLATRGIPVASSTDAGWSVNYFGDFADGLDMLASIGIPAREAFRCATEVPAKALGQVGRLGCLRVGAWADAVVLRADPFEHVGAVRQVEAVYLAGRPVAALPAAGPPVASENR